MTFHGRILLPILATIAFVLCAVVPADAQSGTSGTYGTLTVTGTASVNALDIQGNSAIFGSWITDSTEPGVTFGYSEGTGGTSAAFTTILTRPVATSYWLRLDGSGNAWPVMELDQTNQLILTGTQTSGAGSIVIDPTVGQITINGQAVVTANQLLNLSTSSANIGSGNTVGTSSIGAGTNVTASGSNSAAFGISTTASGAYSTAAGVSTKAQAYGSFVAGAFNSPSGSGTNWVSTDPLFTIGNGTGSSNLSNAMTVLKNGNVGIGTSSPSALLTLSGTNNTTGGLEFMSTAGTAARYAMYPAASISMVFQKLVEGNLTFLGASGSTEMVIDQYGNVGIGTSAPGYSLGVSGTFATLSPGVAMLIDPAQATPNVLDYISISGARTYVGYDGGGNAFIQGSSGKGIHFNVSNGLPGSGTAMTITSGSNVGIGTTSPATALDVNGAIHVSGSAAIAGNLTVSGTANTLPSQTLGGGTNSILTEGLANTLYLTPATANATYLPISPSSLAVGGNASITGTATATSFLGSGALLTNLSFSQISGTLPATQISGTLPSSVSGANLSGVLHGLGGESPTFAALTDTGNASIGGALAVSGTGGSSYLEVTSSGNVGIGTATPQTRLDVSGSVNVSGTLSVTGTASTVLVYQAGDLSMGPFTAGPVP